jgi:septal ring factor EnvC (AmiA/AmiB activator)
MFAWFAENWNWIVFTVIPGLWLAYLSYFPSDDAKKNRRGKALLVSVLTLSIGVSAFFDSQKNDAKTEKIITGLNEQSKSLADQSKALQTQSGDLKAVATDLKSSLQLANAQVFMARVNLAAQLDAQFQLAAENEAGAGSDEVQAIVELNSRTGEITSNEHIVAADRMFRDSTNVNPQEINKYLLDGLRAFKTETEQNEKARADLIETIEKQKQAFTNFEELDKTLFAPLKIPFKIENIDKLIARVEQPPRDLRDLQERINAYSSLAFEMRRINNQLTGAFNQLTAALKRSVYSKMRENVEKQRKELMDKFTPQPHLNGK